MSCNKKKNVIGGGGSNGGGTTDNTTNTYIPVKLSGVFKDSPIHWSGVPGEDVIFDESIDLPPASMKMGEGQITSAVGVIPLWKSQLTGFTYTGLLHQYDDTGSVDRPWTAAVVAETPFVVSGGTDSVPLSGTVALVTTAAEFIQELQLLSDASSTLEGVRLVITSVATGEALYYFPSKSDYLAGIGQDLVADGSGVISLDIREAPLGLLAGQSLTYTYAVDAGVIKGTGSTPALTVIRQLVTLKNVIIDDGAGNVDIDGDVHVGGDVIVDGSVTSASTENLLVTDNYILLNNGYSATVGRSGGIDHIYLPTETAETVTAGAFTAGVPATSNPTVSTDSAAVFAQNDIVMINGSADNDGIYEVHAHAANLLTVRGVGTVPAVEGFSNTQFIANASDSCTIRKVNVTINESDTNGDWRTGKGSETPFTYYTTVKGDIGSNTEVLFNNSGVVGSDPDLTWDGSTLEVNGEMTANAIGIGITPDSLLHTFGAVGDFLGENQYSINLRLGGISGVDRYYLIGTLDDTVTNGHIRISGILAGRNEVNGRALIDVMFSAETTFNVFGTVYGNFVASDIVVYQNAGTYSIYLKATDFSECNFNTSMVGTSSTLNWDGTFTTITPTGTLAYTLSTDAAETLRIGAQGQLGINTVDSDGLLHIDSESTSTTPWDRTGEIVINNLETADNSWVGIEFQTSDSTAFAGGLAAVFTDASSNYVELRLATRGTDGVQDRATINESGVTATTFLGDLNGTINTATTGVTQSPLDNSTKMATTAYVDAAVEVENHWFRDAGLTMLVPQISGDNIGTSGYIRADSGYHIGTQLILDHNVTSRSTAVGFGANANVTSTGLDNYAFGYDALYSNTNGDQNVAIGQSALYNANGADDNVAIGSLALVTNVSGNYNTGVGIYSLRYATGDENTAIGHDSGINITTGSNNIAIGHNAQVALAAGDNQLSIGNTIYGDLSTGKIGIGTNNPDETLSVAGDAIIGQDVTTGLSRLYVGEQVNADQTLVIEYDHDNNLGTLRIGGDASPLGLTVADGGDVGIGTTTPSTNVHVASTTDASIATEYTAAGSFLEMRSGSAKSTIGYDSSRDGLLIGPVAAIRDIPSTGLFLGAVGNVGIGTVAPEYPLHVRHASAGYALIETDLNGNDTGLLFRNSAGESGFVKGGIFFKNTLSGNGRGDMYFALNNVNDSSNVDVTDAKMTLTREGNLSVTGDVNIGGSLISEVQVVNVNEGTTGALASLYHSTTTPANGDEAGSIDFNLDNSAAAETTFASIDVTASEVTSTAESGTLQINTIRDGSAQTRLEISREQTVIPLSGSSLGETFEVRDPDGYPILTVDGKLDVEATNLNTPYGAFGRTQNLLLYSEDLSRVNWSRLNGATVNADNTVAPNGETTADRLNRGTADLALRQSAGLSNGVVYTCSFWAKASSPSSIDIDVAFGGGIPGGVTISDAYWKRYEVTQVAAATGNLDISLITSGAIVWLWGLQVNVGSQAYQYAKTEVNQITAEDYGLAVNGDITMPASGEININDALIITEAGFEHDSAITTFAVDKLGGENLDLGVYDGGLLNIYVDSGSVEIDATAMNVTSQIYQKGGDTVRSNPTNVYDVSTPAELLAITTAMGTTGTFTVTAETVLRINSTDNFISPVNFNVTNAQLDLIINNSVAYIYSNTATFMTVTNSSIRMQDCFIAAAVPGTQLLDITGGSQTAQFWSPIRCTFVSWDPGSVSYIGILARGVLFVDWTDTLEITDVTNVFMTEIASNQASLGVTSKPMISLNSSSGNPVGSINIVTIGGFVLPTESLLRFEPNLSNNLKVTVSNVTLNGTLYDTNGSTGTFTAVADASITAESITSVSDNGSGIARFTHDGTDPVYVHQQITITGYTTNTDYNGIWVVTTATGTYFEVSSIAFGTNEAGGTYSSNSVTITDTGTSLVDGDGITLDCDLCIDYDGGYTVYNQQTNTFQVNATYTATKTGTWSTEGLDQSDPRIVGFGNPAFEDSEYIGFAHIEKNGIATTISTTDTYQDMNLTGSTGSITAFALVGVGITRVTSATHGLANNQTVEIQGTTNYDGIYRIFSVATDTFDIAKTFVVTETGTWYSRLFSGSSNERFKITDLVAGELTYIGNEPFKGNMNFIISALKTGNTETYLFSGALNGDVEQDAPFQERAITTVSGVLSVTVPVDLSKGDTIKPQVASVNTTNSITIRGITIDVSK